MKSKKIAITGGIGSGKSLALRYMNEMGYPTFSCDEIYKEVIQSKAYVEQIALYFPEVIIDGAISRRALAEIVFTNENNRKILNSIAHPLIMKSLNEKMTYCESTLAFAEVPLLFEGNFEKNFDDIIYIYRDKETRIQEVILRDGLTRGEVEKRILTQFDPDSIDGKKRLRECDAYIIDNNNTPEALQAKLSKIIEDMKQ